jgi:hypothetical protein
MRRLFAVVSLSLFFAVNVFGAAPRERGGEEPPLTKIVRFVKKAVRSLGDGCRDAASLVQISEELSLRLGPEREDVQPNIARELWRSTPLGDRLAKVTERGDGSTIKRSG